MTSAIVEIDKRVRVPVVIIRLYKHDKFILFLIIAPKSNCTFKKYRPESHILLSPFSVGTTLDVRTSDSDV